MENILELRRVSKSFPGSSFRLEDISFSLPYGALSEKTGPERRPQSAVF